MNGSRRRVKKRHTIGSRLSPYLFLLPAVAFALVYFNYSAIVTLYYSFTDWDGINRPQFVGLQNYAHIWTDANFQVSIINTVIWVLASLLLPVGLGLLFAVVLNRVRWQNVFKNIIYLPHAMSATASGVIFAFMLSNNGITQLFDKIGLDQLAFNWLQHPPFHTIAMILTYTWQNVGTNMVLFLIGLNAIPKDPLEAGLIDGASGWRLFYHITFPLLRPITSVVVLMSLVNSFKVFDTIWVMTTGGPYRSSETLAVTMYRETFVMSNYGYGSSIAVVLSVIIIVLSWAYLRTTMKAGDA